MAIVRRGSARKPVEQPDLSPAVPEAVAAPAPVIKKTLLGFRAKHHPIRHPYQNVLVPVTGGVPLHRDNWVEVQVQAGVLIEVELR
jgi:hypothetical protein